MVLYVVLEGSGSCFALWGRRAELSNPFGMRAFCRGPAVPEGIAAANPLSTRFTAPLNSAQGSRSWCPWFGFSRGPLVRESCVRYYDTPPGGRPDLPACHNATQHVAIYACHNAKPNRLPWSTRSPGGRRGPIFFSGISLILHPLHHMRSS